MVSLAISKKRKDFAELWTDCYFAFDASVLLDLYRVTPSTRDEILDLLGQLRQRIWLPHQTALEYHDNRLQVISGGQKSFAGVSQLAVDAVDRFRKAINSYREYRWLALERWTDILEKAAKQVKDDLAKEEKQSANLLETDAVQQKIFELFDGRVGKPYADLDPIYRQAELRYQLSIPPGFKDSAKKDYKQYGDVVLWFQLMDFAKDKEKNIIFISSDSKSDWWLEESGKKTGPRPELVQEMHNKAGRRFHLYSSSQFIKHAKKILKVDEAPKVIDAIVGELREVEKQKDLLQKAVREAQGQQTINLLQSQNPFAAALQNAALFRDAMAANPITRALEELQRSSKLFHEQNPLASALENARLFAPSSNPFTEAVETTRLRDTGGGRVGEMTTDNSSTQASDTQTSSTKVTLAGNLESPGATKDDSENTSETDQAPEDPKSK